MVKSIRIPDTIPFPPLLDLWEQQEKEGPDATKIYQFYKNLAEGRFTTTKCKDCGKLLYPPVAICSECLSENLVWVDIPKVGEVYAFTEILAGVPLQFQDKVPFVVAIVRFGNYPENGIQLSGIVFDASYDEMEVGAKVEWEPLEILGPGEKRRYWYCFKKV